MYLTGALIMAWNLWMTIRNVGPRPADSHLSRPAE
jgi:cbb3-type cytochrome oxidase subunit 1